MQEFYLDTKSNILFAKNKKGYYDPIAVDFDEKTGKGKLIANDPVLLEAYEFAMYHQRKRNNKGKYVSDPVFPYQWSFYFRHILSLLNQDGDQKLESYARQSGKSFSIKLLIAWELTFLPKYINVRLQRYSLILCSYKKESVEKLFAECKTAVYKAVEFYNKRHKDKLVYKNGEYSNSKLIDSSIKLELNKLFTDGDEVEYSQGVAITLGTTNDGLSAYHIIVDEGGLCDYELFNISVAPFTASVNGATTIIGVPNQDSSSLLHRKFSDKTVKNTIYNADDVYHMRKMVDEDFADKYKKNFDKELASHGAKSSHIRWNYYLDFFDMNGKFITRELLEDNRVMTETISKPVSDKNNKKSYIVAGIDVASSGDYKPMIIGTTIINDDGYMNKVCDMITFNKEGRKQSLEEFAKNCVEKCIEYEVDAVCIDATSVGGQSFVQQFRKYMKQYKVSIMILPFAYNQNKMRLFGSLENSVFNGSIKLLKEDESWESAKLIEEMLYMIKEKAEKGSTQIKYYAPKGGDFTDDHMNSLALFDICIQEINNRIHNKDKQKWLASDGVERWRLRLKKFSRLTEGENKEEKKEINSWCMTL